MWFSGYNAGNFLPHIICPTISATQHTTLMRFRLGCADLAVNKGRQAFHADKVPRSERFCTMPGCHRCMEDEKHLVFECKAYSHIRLDPKYCALFKPVWIGDMRRFFNNNAQPVLARFISDMVEYRNTTLRSQKIAGLVGAGG